MYDYDLVLMIKDPIVHVLLPKRDECVGLGIEELAYRELEAAIAREGIRAFLTIESIMECTDGEFD